MRYTALIRHPFNTKPERFDFNYKGSGEPVADEVIEAYMNVDSRGWNDPDDFIKNSRVTDVEEYEIWRENWDPA